MAKVILIANHKGGVGKTQTSLELSWYLATKGYKVLALDLDHQAHLTYLLSSSIKISGPTLSEILINNRVITKNDVCHRNLDNAGHGLDFIPASLALGRLEKKLPDDSPKEYLLKDSLDAIRNEYDYIILDAPPSAEIISIAALVAADYVLVTSLATTLSAAGVEGILPVIRKVQSHPRMNPNLSVLGILITMYEETNDAKRALAEMKSVYGDLVLEPFIRKCTKVREANRTNVAVQVYAPACTSSIDYSRVFEEILRRIS